METKEYFEKVMLDYNQNRKGRSLLKYFRGCISFQIINRVIFHRWLAVLSIFFLQAVPFRTIWRRPLMVRQPYSVAVPSTGGRLHPLVPEEREAWREKWSSPCRRNGEVDKTPSLTVRKDG